MTVALMRDFKKKYGFSPTRIDASTRRIYVDDILIEKSGAIENEKIRWVTHAKVQRREAFGFQAVRFKGYGIWHQEPGGERKLMTKPSDD